MHPGVHFFLPNIPDIPISDKKTMDVLKHIIPPPTTTSLAKKAVLRNEAERDLEIKVENEVDNEKVETENSLTPVERNALS